MLRSVVVVAVMGVVVVEVVMFVGYTALPTGLHNSAMSPTK